MKRKRPAPPLMMAQLAIASWETILRRTQLMASGNCSAAEYQRMVTEKLAATQAASLALMSGRSGAAIMAPYLKRARANAKRLRPKKSS